MPSHSAKNKKTVTPKVSAASAAKAVKKPVFKAPARTRYARAAKAERVVVAPVMSCQLKKLLQDRADKKRLKAHFNAILAHKAKYKQRKKIAEAKRAKGDVSEVHAIPAHKAKITEAEGEYEATLLMIQQYVAKNGTGDTYSIGWTFTPGVGIDQMWYSASADTYILVEAKGPGAMLSSGAAKGDQMTKQWVRASLASVVNSKTSSDDDKAHARKMIGAMDNGPPPKVIGRVIEAEKGGGAREVSCPDKGIYHAT
jgi:hypothetical protein